MISSELPEVLRMSHRIVVMCEGRVTGVLDDAEATQETVMQLRHPLRRRRNDRIEHDHDRPAATPTTPARATARRPSTHGCADRLQQLLAFASLIVIFVFFSIASPHFLTTSNVIVDPARDRR